jgi:hypothetical protein
MTPEDDKFSEYMEILNELQDRMIKAGLITAHGHFEKAELIRGDFTPSGQDAVSSIVALDTMLGPLSNRQIVALWLYFRGVGKERMNRRS